MVENIIVQTINNIVKKDVCTSMCGSIIGSGTTSCKLDKKYGGVYGIAVRLSPSDASAFATKNNLNHKNIKSISDWKSIGDDFYPLYWGKDSRLGSRIYAHLNKYKGTGAANLCKHKELRGKEVIFGICICNDYEKGEKNLHRAFPALYTKSTAGA